MTASPGAPGAGAPGMGATALVATALAGVPEVTAGTDLAAAIARACETGGVVLEDGDVVVVASKVVAKAEGRSLPATDRATAVDAQTVRVVAERTLPDGRVTRVVQSRTGPVLAAAGVDASDVEPGTVLLLPRDPDASARRLRGELHRLTGARPAVLVSDTSGRPWRQGVTDFALGAAGLVCLDDVRGAQDRFGRPLEVTVRAVGDEIAAVADLVRGKATGLPVAVVRGAGRYVTAEDGEGAAGCVRTGATDWFAYGHVEAVRASLGVEPGRVAAAPIDLAGSDTAARVRRAVEVAGAGPPAGQVEVRPGPGGLVLTGDRLWAGVLAQRLLCTLWTEGLAARVEDRGHQVAVVLV